MFKLSRITLTTGHLPELSQFLSQLFETEIIPQENGVLLKGEQDFLLIPQAKVKAKENSFQYTFDNLDNLNEFLNNVNFIRYRQGLGSLVLEKNSEGQFFKLLDPDCRTWQFSFLRNNRV